MIHIKNKSSLQKMEQAGHLLASIFNTIGSQIVAGTTTLAIDSWIAGELARLGLKSKSQGYMGYRHVSCISVNDEVVHGIPSEKKILYKGDLIKVDVCASWQDYCADMARSFFVGSANIHTQQLVDVAQKALDKGIA